MSAKFKKSEIIQDTFEQFQMKRTPQRIAERKNLNAKYNARHKEMFDKSFPDEIDEKDNANNKKLNKTINKILHKRLSYRSNKDTRATLRLHSDDYETQDRSRSFTREFINEKENARASLFFS